MPGLPVGSNSRKQLKSLHMSGLDMAQSYSKWIFQHFHLEQDGLLQQNQMYNCITCHLNGLNCWVSRCDARKTASFFGHPNFPDTPEIWPRELTLPKTNSKFAPGNKPSPKKEWEPSLPSINSDRCYECSFQGGDSEWNRGISPKQADFSYWSRMEIELNIIYIYIILIPPKKENSILK